MPPAGKVGSSTNNAAAAAARRAAEERAAAARRAAQQSAQHAQKAQHQAQQTQSHADADRRKASDAAHYASNGGLNAEQRRKYTNESDRLNARAASLDSKAKAERTQADALTKTAQDKANAALKSEQAANRADRADGVKEKYAAADKQRDVYDAGSLSHAEQKQLFGTSAPVSAKEAAQSDANALGSRVNKEMDPAKQAKLYASGLKELMASGGSAEYRKALGGAASEQLQALGSYLTSHDAPDQKTLNSVMSDLAKAGEVGGPDVAKAMGKGFASGMDEKTLPNVSLPTFSNEGVPGALKSAIKDGQGASFAVGLAQGLREQGKPGQAVDVEQATTEGIHDVKADFTKAEDRVKQLNGELARFVAEAKGFGPDKLKDAVAAFQKQHKAEYEALDKEGARAASILPGATLALSGPKADTAPTPGSHGEPVAGNQALLDASKGMVGDVDQIYASGKGALKQLAAGMHQEREEGAGWIQKLNDLKEQIEPPNKAREIGNALQTASIKATALTTLEASARGDHAAVKSALDDLRASGKINGFGDKFDELTGSIEKLNKPGASAGELARLQEDVSKQIRGFSAEPGGEGVGRAFKGLGLVLSLGSLGKGFEDFDKEGALDKVKTLASAGQFGADGGGLVLDLLGKDSSTLAGTLGKASAGLGAVVGGISAYQDFSQGHILQGAGDVASTAGGALVAIGAVNEAVPVEGQIVGTALIAIGGAISIGTSLFGTSPEEKLKQQEEKDARAFLGGLGFNDKAAEELSKVDDKGRTVLPFFMQAAKDAKYSPEFLTKYLNTLADAGKLGDVAGVARDVIPAKHDKNQEPIYSVHSNDPQDGYGKILSIDEFWNTVAQLNARPAEINGGIQLY